SGIGFALADKCLQEGMNVVLADIEENKLKETAENLSKHKKEILTVKTDVAKIIDIDNLAKKSFEKFNNVHLLFNNAGVSVGGPPLWEYTINDWQWVMGVNLWGVIYGIHIFLPLMLSHGQEGHIVNTASEAGLLSSSYMGVYNITKHGVVTLSETLYNELQKKKASISVSVLCPGLVNTNILDSSRNRNIELQNNPKLEEERLNRYKKFHDWITRGITKGLDPKIIANQVFDSIREDKFYIITHDWINKSVKIRMDNIINGSNPEEP
ncbi:MAG: SDR family NAD(P)-dependent oxidoreductase, partial [Candidatus Thorarchaeota archaeon]